MHFEVPDADPERPRHRFSETLFITLHKSVFPQMATNRFAPKPSGAQIVQLGSELLDSRRAPILCGTEKLIADTSQAAPPDPRRNGKGERLLKLAAVCK